MRVLIDLRISARLRNAEEHSRYRQNSKPMSHLPAPELAVIRRPHIVFALRSMTLSLAYRRLVVTRINCRDSGHT